MPVTSRRTISLIHLGQAGVGLTRGRDSVLLRIPTDLDQGRMSLEEEDPREADPLGLEMHLLVMLLQPPEEMPQLETTLLQPPEGMPQLEMHQRHPLGTPLLSLRQVREMTALTRKAAAKMTPKETTKKEIRMEIRDKVSLPVEKNAEGS